MIKKFLHKGLQNLVESNSARGIETSLVKRLSLRLRVLDDSTMPSDMDVPGWDLHPLKGARTGVWAVKVSGNWRLTFRFVDGHAVDVDLEDYH